MTLRPAREISIEVRRRALHDPANYDPGPLSQAMPAERGKWPLRLLMVAFCGLAGGLSLLAFQLPDPWGLPTAAMAAAGVWAFWKVTDLGARLAGRHRGGRHRRTRRRASISDIDRLHAMLETDTDVSGGHGRTEQSTVSRS